MRFARIERAASMTAVSETGARPSVFGSRNPVPNAGGRCDNVAAI